MSRRHITPPSRPSVSVVICAYTEERWDDIVAAVASVRAQTLPAHELLMVIDHNKELFERARTLDVTLLENAGPRGLAAARNTGVAAATGDVVAFLDDDARAAADWLAALIEPYADEQVLGVGGHIEAVWSTREPRWFPSEFYWVVGCTYTGMPTRDGAVRNMIGANMSLRRRVFEEVGGFSSSLGRIGKLPVGCEETELCIRASQRWPDGRFMHVPAAKVWHRQPASRATWRYFLSRCYAEGRSKAILSRLVGRGDGLASERAYAARVLPAGVLRGVAQAIRGDLGGLGRAAAIVAGLAVTASGFLVGSRHAATDLKGEAIPGPSLAPSLPVASDRRRGNARLARQAVPMASSRDPHAAATSWGWLPALCLTAAVGLLGVSGAYLLARKTMGDPLLVYWGGMALIVVLPLLRLLATSATRRERIGLVLLMTAAFYVMKLMYAPSSFVFPDELQHLRTAEDLQMSGRLFEPNSILPISPLFPGLESVTIALASMSGLSIFHAGVFVIAASRLTLALGIFLLFEHASRSARTAGIAAFVYMGNPSFIHFGGQFVYESLALPLSIVVLYLVARRDEVERSRRIAMTILLLLAGAAVIVTHHASALVLTAILALWAVVIAMRDQLSGIHQRLGPRGPALIVGLGILGWVAYVAEVALAYLGPYAAGSVQQALRLLSGEFGDRVLFGGSAGRPPQLEQVASFAGVGVMLLALPIGLFWVWRRYRERPLVLMLALLATAYPMSLALRLTQAGQDVAGRASPWLFLGLSLVVALAVTERLGRRRPWVPIRIAHVVGGLLIFVSGLVSGFPFYARLPGPYLVGGESRAFEEQGIEAALWTREALGPGNRVIADRTNRLLMGSYGQQYLITGADTDARISDLYNSPSVGAVEQEILQRGQVRYLVVDRRLSTSLPAVGIYFERGERRRTAPLDLVTLGKFDRAPQISRIFDSGDIQIYDVEGLIDAR